LNRSALHFSIKFGGPEKGRFVNAGVGGLGLGWFLGLLGQENSLDVGQDTTLSDGDTRQELVQFFVVTDGQLQVTRDDPSLLVVTSGVTGQLENFSGQVLHDGSQVDWSSGTNALGVATFAEHTVDTTDGELKSGAARTGLGLSLNFASLSASRHVEGSKF
jgi:hypothetical protein